MIPLTLMFYSTDLWSVSEAPAANRKVFDDTIILHNAKAFDSAVYQCEASNRHGTLLSNANIMIMGKWDRFWFCEPGFSSELSSFYYLFLRTQKHNLQICYKKCLFHSVSE